MSKNVTADRSSLSSSTYPSDLFFPKFIVWSCFAPTSCKSKSWIQHPIYNVTPLLSPALHPFSYASPTIPFMSHYMPLSGKSFPLFPVQPSCCNFYLCPCLASSHIPVAMTKERRPTAKQDWERSCHHLSCPSTPGTTGRRRRRSSGEELNTRGMRRDLIACPGLSLPEVRALAM